jgi:Uma2 family endonuclease
MMMAEVPLSAVARARLSYAEYLAVEASSEARHEFHDGELYAMAGGTPAHARLIQQTGWALGNALRAKPCLAQSSAQRIHLADGRALYPDAIVVCPPLVHPPEDPDAIANPVVVVEVLSDGTERYDRGRKFAYYQSISSLHHYVLVVQDAWRVEHYRRTDDGRWTLSVHGPGERVPLDAVDAELSVDDLYDRIEAFGGPARDAPYPPAGVV